LESFEVCSWMISARWSDCLGLLSFFSWKSEKNREQFMQKLRMAYISVLIWLSWIFVFLCFFFFFFFIESCFEATHTHIFIYLFFSTSKECKFSFLYWSILSISQDCFFFFFFFYKISLFIYFLINLYFFIKI
jgi:hypothetical protein